MATGRRRTINAKQNSASSNEPGDENASYTEH